MLQETSKRDRKEYNQRLDPVALINAIESTGYSPIGDYTEQAYYNKTMFKNTDKHGQYNYSLLSDTDKLLGLSVNGARDCQLPLSMYIGLRKQDQIVPVVPVVRVKHNKSNTLPDKETLNRKVKESLKQFKATLQALLNNYNVTRQNVNDCFDQVNEYRQGLMNCGLISYPDTIPDNKLELFSLLVNSFVMGKAYNVTGKKARKIKHLRDILHLTDYIYKMVIA